METSRCRDWQRRAGAQAADAASRVKRRESFLRAGTDIFAHSDTAIAVSTRKKERLNALAENLKVIADESNVGIFVFWAQKTSLLQVVTILRNWGISLVWSHFPCPRALSRSCLRIFETPRTSVRGPSGSRSRQEPIFFFFSCFCFVFGMPG